MGEYFEIKQGLRQGCVKSQLLFYLFYDRMVRREDDRADGKGVKSREEVGGVSE